MESVCRKVLEHCCSSNRATGEEAVADLIIFLNNQTKLKFPSNSIAIYNIIRLSYVYFMDRKMQTEASLIVEKYRPKIYVWKVINKYKK